MALDLGSIRGNGKRKSAVEILQETKSLYVKSEVSGRFAAKDLKVKRKKCADDSELNFGHQIHLESTLRSLISNDELAPGDQQSSNPNSVSSEDLTIMKESNISYRSLPDLSSLSSRESHEIRSLSLDDSVTSYGKPPSLVPTSILTPSGGSMTKLELHIRRKKWTDRQRNEREFKSEDNITWCPPYPKGDSCLVTTPEPTLDLTVPPSLNSFFSHLGLSASRFELLNDVRDAVRSPPVYFSSVESVDSVSRVRVAGSGDEPSDSQPVSIVQTNARIIKWLCRTSKWS